MELCLLWLLSAVLLLCMHAQQAGSSLSTDATISILFVHILSLSMH